MSAMPVIAVSIGDPNGIGPEIAVGASLACGAPPVRLLVVGDGHVVKHYARARRAEIRILPREGALPDPANGVIDVINVSALANDDFSPGDCSAASGAATVDYLKGALGLVSGGMADAVVGCPHNETAVNASGIHFRGYPDLLARLTDADPDAVILMLAGGGYCIAHTTLHEAVSHAVGRLTKEMVCRAAETTIAALQSMGKARPVLGLFGIDPHAGENGLFGDADQRITMPAAKRLRAAGHTIAGPAGADLLLSQNECDGYLAMFHDQGHIPIKLVAGRESVAFSIGAGFLFASVGHGSAPDIAGRGTADHAPLARSINAVSRMCQKHA